MTERSTSPNIPMPSSPLQWLDVLLPASSQTLDPQHLLVQRLLVAFGLLFAVVTIPWYIWIFAVDPEIRLPRVISMTTISIMILMPLWLRVARTGMVGLLTVILMHCVILLNILLNGGLAGPVALVLPCLPIVTGVLLGTRAAWVDGALVISFAVVVEFVVGPSTLPITAPEAIWPLIRLASLAICLGIMVLTASAFAQLTLRQAQELRWIALHDRLTGLCNRHYIAEKLPLLMQKVGTGQNNTLAIVLVDIDDFKRINDDYDHSVGDRVLQQFAALLQSATPDQGFVARWGGEEFILVWYVDRIEGLIDQCSTINDRIRETVFVGPSTLKLRLTCSIGVAHVPAGFDGTDWAPFVRFAGLALKEAKNNGKDQTVAYLWSDHSRSSDWLSRDHKQLLERHCLVRKASQSGFPTCDDPATDANCIH